MLFELVKLAEALEDELPPRLYSRSKVSFLIDLDADGKFMGIVFFDQDQLVPHLGRNGDKAKLLVDTAEYVLGLGERGSRRFLLFVELVKRCAEATNEPSVKAVVKFLENLPAIQHENLTSGSVIGFRVNDGNQFEKPHDLPSVREFWASRFEPSRPGSRKQHCLVTGKECIPETKVQAKIKGVPNTQGSGASLTSAFLESTYSYGLQQAAVAPMSPTAVEAYSQSLNYLLKSKEHSLRVGGVAYVLWHLDGGDELDLTNLLDKPSLEEAQRWFQAHRQPSQYRSNIESDAIYILGLTGASGRIVVRDWLTQTLPEVQEAVKQWLANQRLIDFQGKWGQPLGVWQLAAAAYLESKDILERHLVALTRNALLGDRLPRDLLLRCLERIRAEQQPSYRQSVLIRLFLCSQGLCKAMSEIKDPGEYLDDFATDELKCAYCLGRLLAIYHQIQSAAQNWRSDTNAVRRYATASVTPIQVFPQLEGMLRYYLSELSEGTRIYFERLISEVKIAMPKKQYPRRLTPEQQAAFGQGFWIQRYQPKRDFKTNKNTTEI